jgi:hypothetical protein
MKLSAENTNLSWPVASQKIGGLVVECVPADNEKGFISIKLPSGEMIYTETEMAGECIGKYHALCNALWKPIRGY